jgi:hypothetical protein
MAEAFTAVQLGRGHGWGVEGGRGQGKRPFAFPILRLHGRCHRPGGA